MVEAGRSLGEAGTSPRMRGKRGVVIGVFLKMRNIPAYAGKTFGWTVSAAQQPEHPRVCGENSYNCSGNRRRRGTSPRMRGKHELALKMRFELRNIPAYAGKTVH